MRLAKIKSLEKKAIKECQKAVDEIMAKYSNQINSAIKEQIPKGYTLYSFNGMCVLEDETGERVKRGVCWSISDGENPQLEYLSSLQYAIDKDDLSANFLIEQEIKN